MTRRYSERVFVYLIIAAIGWAVPDAFDLIPAWVAVWKFAGFVAAFIAAVIGVEWVANMYAQYYREKRTADAITPARMILQAAAQMSDAAQLELSTKLATWGFDWASMMFRVGDYIDFSPYIPDDTVPGGRIPGWFVREFLEACDHRHLTPISSWHHETRNHRYAQALVMRFVQSGLAEMPKTAEGVYAGGNRPARWLTDSRGRSYYWRVLYSWGGVLFRELSDPEQNPFRAEFEKQENENAN